MSTSYYALRQPITSLRLNDIGGHTEITVFINHVHAGSICARNGRELTSVMRNVFSSTQELYHSNGGWSRYTRPEYMLSDDAQLISEYGELITVGEIKEKYAER